MQLEEVQPAIERAAELLERARLAGIPIIHVMHDAGEDSPYDVRAEIGRIVDMVAPLNGEPVIVKTFPNSFTGDSRAARHRRHDGARGGTSGQQLGRHR